MRSDRCWNVLKRKLYYQNDFWNLITPTKRTYPNSYWVLRYNLQIVRYIFCIGFNMVDDKPHLNWRKRNYYARRTHIYIPTCISLYMQEYTSLLIWSHKLSSTVGQTQICTNIVTKNWKSLKTCTSPQISQLFPTHVTVYLYKIELAQISCVWLVLYIWAASGKNWKLP